MTTGLSYNGSVAGTTSYVTQIATMAVVAENDPAFLIVLPQMITYAENRIYRDLDLVATTQTLDTFTLSAGNRQISVPASDFVVVDQINVVTTDGNGDVTQTPLLPATKEFLDNVFGSSAYRGLPKYFCPLDQTTFLVGPYPDQAYSCAITGTTRPASLSATTPTTFISLYLPDLLIMASMIYVSGYQRNFGRANDDPQMAVSYESQYQTLLRAASVEEARKKFEAAAWSSQSPALAATPTRG